MDWVDYHNLTTTRANVFTTHTLGAKVVTRGSPVHNVVTPHSCFKTEQSFSCSDSTTSVLIGQNVLRKACNKLQAARHHIFRISILTGQNLLRKTSIEQLYITSSLLATCKPLGLLLLFCHVCLYQASHTIRD